MRHLIAVLFTLGLTACSSVSVDDYRDRQPAFSPEQSFAGALTTPWAVSAPAKNCSGENAGWRSR